MRLGIARHFLWPELLLLFDGPLRLADHSSKRPQRGGSPTPLAPALTGTLRERQNRLPWARLRAPLGVRVVGGGNSSNVAARFSDVTNQGGCKVRVRLMV